ncbi:DUF6415 family natural product biosynthesis protein [Streptomyces alanosinicus]|uniref:Uncharacterized protein n=1 Tax=Streptomyces alanosinicus TaxID=68171 RepID=A0A918YDA3_9ACTN|nr:DUF6415 family natural product biosynthesis protein [Streptomyces alanosinicus]GHD98624.1 hypothetical protein GCM10010339_06540 [Streptomyces alanosinicus]
MDIVMMRETASELLGPRYCALTCVGEASRKLRVGKGCPPSVRVAVARRLARSGQALCDQYEKLTGGDAASERS